MNTYIVTVVIENGNPQSPPDVHLYGVSATSKEEAEQRATANITVPIVTVASRGLPQKWPSYDGEVIVI